LQSPFEDFSEKKASNFAFVEQRDQPSEDYLN
jgi:hypothetical protein